MDKTLENIIDTSLRKGTAYHFLHTYYAIAHISREEYELVKEMIWSSDPSNLAVAEAFLCAVHIRTDTGKIPFLTCPEEDIRPFISQQNDTEPRDRDKLDT